MVLISFTLFKFCLEVSEVCIESLDQTKSEFIPLKVLKILKI